VSGESTLPGYYLGTISGTSVDGLDLALLDLSDGIRFVATGTEPFPEDLRSSLLNLGQPGEDDLDKVGALDAELGQFIGDSINRFLLDRNLNATEIRAIGSHGQTVRHRPDLPVPFTWQIGDPNRIAEICRITTVADFRRRDMAAGGQGAPLVPLFHEALFRTTDESRVVVNIGGIGNLTVLDRNPSVPVSGFDTGPGNALMDAWCESNSGSPFDSDGDWARSGSLSDSLLEALCWDPYLAKPPPKSTGREYFNLDWLDQYTPHEQSPVDIQRTLLEYTATTIIDAVDEWASPCERLIICGGGRRNGFLMSRLKALGGMPVDTSEDHGFDGDAIEAAAFAWLAARRMASEPGNASAVTGARGARILGALYPA